jgi:hypothetical protein
MADSRRDSEGGSRFSDGSAIGVIAFVRHCCIADTARDPAVHTCWLVLLNRAAVGIGRCPDHMCVHAASWCALTICQQCRHGGVGPGRPGAIRVYCPTAAYCQWQRGQLWHARPQRQHGPAWHACRRPAQLQWQPAKHGGRPQARRGGQPTPQHEPDDRPQQPRRPLAAGP